mmetsp:Transcript_31109/g.92645  ORF Transcript_31109/g.92645 Transcript_31109/m.92645 type:complete len:210 (-) Transcript_31109:630-1259(-)
MCADSSAPLPRSCPGWPSRKTHLCPFSSNCPAPPPCGVHHQSTCGLHISCCDAASAPSCRDSHQARVAPAASAPAASRLADDDLLLLPGITSTVRPPCTAYGLAIRAFAAGRPFAVRQCHMLFFHCLLVAVHLLMASSHSQPSHPPRIKSTTCSQGKHECPGIPLRCSHKEAPRLDSSVMSTGPSHKNAAMCDPRKASYARSVYHRLVC